MASKHNFKAQTISKVMLDEMVSVINHAANEYKIAVQDQFKTKSPPPSSPGSPPGVRTGMLRSSFLATPVRKIGGRLILALGTNTKYARPLEYGARLPGGQPYFRSRKIASKQGFPIPGTDIAFARKGSPFASRMRKTKPGRLAARPFFGPAMQDQGARASVDKRIAAAGDRIRRMLRTKVRPIA